MIGAQNIGVRIIDATGPVWRRLSVGGRGILIGYQQLGLVVEADVEPRRDRPLGKTDAVSPVHGHYHHWRPWCARWRQVDTAWYLA